MCHGTFVSGRQNISASAFLNDSILGRYSGSLSWYTLMPLGFCKMILKSPGILSFRVSTNVLLISFSSVEPRLLIVIVSNTGGVFGEAAGSVLS